MPTQTINSLGNDMLSKYNFLLQPIRDLTKNWDIDVAAQLEEYLNEIEKIQISFDGGKTTMNFAEAALLIQGSACIYSKKVEYLYTLVYQTLDLIASKKRLQQAVSVEDRGPDNDVTLGGEEEFLSLDDIQESKNIDLKDDDYNIKNEASQIIPRTPLALIPLGERDRQDMLLSHTGEVLGSRNDFKMNTCTVHSSGALLLDLGNLTLADSSFRRLPTSTPQPTCGILQQETCKDQQDHQPLEEPATDNQFPVPDTNMYNDGDDGYDDGDAGGGAEEMYQQDVCEADQGEQEPSRMELRRRDKQQQQQYQPQKLQVQDSWELLDPHNPGKHDEKPFRKGRPFKLPASLMEMSKKDNKKKRKRNETTEKKQVLIPLQEFCTMAFHSHASKFPKNPLKAPVYKEFEYLYWVEFRRRQELEKKQKKMLAEYLTQEQIEDLDAVVPENNEIEQQEDGPVYVGPEGNDDYGDDDDNFSVPENNMPDNDQLMAPEEPQEELLVSGYEDLVRRYVHLYLFCPEKEVMPFAEMMKNKEPFEICRYFLATLQLANNYNVEVSSEDATKRVDTMKLKLLHKTPAHDAIQSYRAPSIMT
ncbi:condensin-2 complex subunit H2-like [Actinia tenebrosa]|uniref:Condensin-2 complex subunit H2 n=1 Tax=Actinia tenebrosa TaxID=6105 RepID=A0A6P8J0B5_ACTTE|nr:condensin-2 complex subunit H2-like [Actinia tenebrosa]